MKSKEELLKRLYATLAELEYGVDNKELEQVLKVQLGLLYDILGDDVKEEYWERIEDII